MIDILRKCVEELGQEKPRLDYVRGMLETLIFMNDPNKRAETIEKAVQNFPNTIGILRATSHAEETQDEAAIMDARAKAALQTVKSISEESSHE